MSDENTADLTLHEKLDLLLAEVREVKATVGNLDTRLTALESKVEDRLHDTRPLWQRVQQQIQDLNTDVQDLKTEVVDLKTEVVDLKTEVVDLKTEVVDLKAEVVDLKTELVDFKTETNARFESVEKELRLMGRTFEVFSLDIMKMRTDMRDFNERLVEVERRPM